MSHRSTHGSPHPSLSRRALLGAGALGAASLAADMSQVNLLAQPVLADELRKQQKRVILLWLAGGASQLETFDPKPGRPTGGPFRAIPTSVPGVHISELMPQMAKRIHKHTAILRSLNTKNGDHGGGAELMMRGRRDEPNVKYPDLGAVLARELGQIDSQVPDYISLYSSTEGRNSSRPSPGFLGARYAPILLSENMSLPNVKRLEAINEIDHQERAELRDLLSKRWLKGRENNTTSSHSTAYSRVKGLMASDKLFDVSQEPTPIRDKYGPTQFAEQCLIARRLCEAGVPFVSVARAWWDSHGQNFETHLELVSELDHVMSTLLDDLDSRGLLENTLVITMGEFGRTPQINSSLGRDHFASAWSVSLSGCGVKHGACYGKTDEDGNHVKDGEIGAGEFFATIYEALGISHEKHYQLGSRPIPLVNPGIHPVRDVLA